jgi:Protein of unknown function (DUF1186)
MSLETYTDPVAKLLTYGDCSQMDLRQWPNYLEEVGLTSADIPELIRMATDPIFWELDSERIEVWAPIHAWRSLGQLKAEAASAPLIELFHIDIDWVSEELPEVYAMIGPAAVPALSDYLANDSQDPWNRVTASSSLRQIAQKYPDHQDACVTPILQQLEAFEDNEIELNTMLISDLMDLKVVEAAPLIEQIFAAEKVDEFMIGTWAAIQVELGLKQEADFSPEELKPKFSQYLTEVGKMLELRKTTVQNSKGFGTASQPKAKKGKKKKK